ncbi:hypothetical protein GF406_26700 [candidate division KSB1 bacterium]|nr:hypothetical protein [candidate division KSB1 bacterium]
MMNKLLCILFCFYLVIPMTLQGEPDQDLYCGFSRIDITPPVGYRRAGNFREIITTGVRDSLYAKAMVFRQGTEQAVLVFCDLTSISPVVAQQARQQIAAQTDILASNIIISATHAHTAPLYFGIRRKLFHEQALKKYQGSDPHEEIDYPKHLTAQIVQTVSRAQNSLQPVQISAGYTWQTGLSFHRRFYMKPGSERLRQPGAVVRMNPGRMHPDILRPAGPIDPKVNLLFFRNPDNTPLASLVNFALHLDTVGGTEFSADYPYFLQQIFQQKYGPEFYSFFGLAPCGEINHIDVTTKEPLTTETIGKTLAKTALDYFGWLDPVDKPALAVESKTIRVPMKSFDSKELAKAEKDIHLMGTSEIAWLDQVQANTILNIQARESKELAIEIQAIRLSDNVALLALPGEVFTELGLAIRKAVPFETVFIFELSNDGPGYIPTRQGFHKGGYETVNALVAPGGGEAMADAAIELLQELHASF